MHSVTNRQTDRRQDDANSRSYSVAVRWAKNEENVWFKDVGTYATANGKKKLGAVEASWYQNSSRKKNENAGWIIIANAKEARNAVPRIGRYLFPTSSITAIYTASETRIANLFMVTFIRKWSQTTQLQETERTEDRQTYYNYCWEKITRLKSLQTASKIAPEQQVKKLWKLVNI